jgi:hypothetical protein
MRKRATTATALTLRDDQQQRLATDPQPLLALMFRRRRAAIAANIALNALSVSFPVAWHFLWISARRKTRAGLRCQRPWRRRRPGLDGRVSKLTSSPVPHSAARAPGFRRPPAGTLPTRRHTAR